MRISLVAFGCSPLARPGQPGHSGRGEHVVGLGRNLAAAGHDVVVEARKESPDQPRSVELPGDVTVRLHDGAGGGPEAGVADELARLESELERSWRRDRPDLVHVHSCLAGLAATGIARNMRLPLVATFHGRHGMADGRATVDSERVVATRAARIAASSRNEVLALRRIGIDANRVREVPYGVDSDVFAPEGPAIRRSKRPRLVVLGGLDGDGGIDDLLVAMRRVPGAELYVAGGPDASDPDGAADQDGDLARVSERSREVGVAGRVRFLGAVRREVVPMLLRSADVVVHVPHRTSFGLPAVEAMGCGRAVVASTTGALRDIVVDQVTGVLVPPRRPDVLGGALARLLAQPALVSALGIAGRDRAVARFSWSRVGATMLELYDEAVTAVDRHATA